MRKQNIFKILGKYYSHYQIYEILIKITGLSRNQLFLIDNIDNFLQQDLDKIDQLSEKKYPFEYIVQKAEFYNLHFFVDERVLIPRNDTEVMVEQVLETIKGIIPPSSNTPLEKEKKILIDIGTGSSCIPIAILQNSTQIDKSYVIDISHEALEVSKINIQTHNLGGVITQLKGSLLTPVIPHLMKHSNKQLIITANLPYIKDNDHDNMDKQTIQFEPDLALYGGPETGFELYETLIKQCRQYKSTLGNNNIDLFIEIGFDQEMYSQQYLQQLGLTYTKYKDNSDIVRCLHIKI